MNDFGRGKVRKTNAPRGFPKAGECKQSRVSWVFTSREIKAGTHTCSCGATLKLRVLSPGMQGEKRVSGIVPAHKVPVKPEETAK